jgi:hypothetical protein
MAGCRPMGNNSGDCTSRVGGHGTRRGETALVPRAESGFIELGRDSARLPGNRPDPHGLGSPGFPTRPLTRTPQRRSTVSRFGRLGTHGIRLDVGVSDRSSRARHASGAPTCLSSTPNRRRVPRSPKRRVVRTSCAGSMRPGARRIEQCSAVNAAHLFDVTQSPAVDFDQRQRQGAVVS